MKTYTYTDYKDDIKVLCELRSGNDTIFVNGKPNSDRMFRGGISDSEYELILQKRIAEYELRNPIARITRLFRSKASISKKIRMHAKLKIGLSNVTTTFLIIWIGGGLLLTVLGLSPQLSFFLCLVVGLTLSFLLEC